VTEAPNRVTELDLVQGIRSGDPAAFRELVRRYGDDLYGLAFSLVGNAADAEDVVQQGFLGALNSIGRFEGRSSLRTWLHRIVLNQASKARRSRRARRAVSLDACGDSSGGGPGGVDGLPTVRPASVAVDGRLDATTMLEALSPEHREVLVLRELQGLSYEEIAAALGVPRGTVESRLFRARRCLREQFEKSDV
jgi:RNA polymerase sigma-70 factor (ECF subfamily)